jgi:hypothetical protein
MVDRFICPHCLAQNGELNIKSKKRTRGKLNTKDNLKKHLSKNHLQEYVTLSKKFKCPSKNCCLKFDKFSELFDHIQGNHPEYYGTEIIIDHQNCCYKHQSIGTTQEIQNKIAQFVS